VFEKKKDAQNEKLSVILNNARYEVLRVVLLKIQVFWGFV
jgi:hypothetical protein